VIAWRSASLLLALDELWLVELEAEAKALEVAVIGGISE
jgi:hypothetical protein